MFDPRDEACAEEAERIWKIDILTSNRKTCSRDALIEAARLGREGWTPTDPLLLKAREIVKAKWASPAAHESIDRGEWDGNHDIVQHTLTALREGIRMAKEGSDV